MGLMRLSKPQARSTCDTCTLKVYCRYAKPGKRRCDVGHVYGNGYSLQFLFTMILLALAIFIIIVA